MISAVVVNCPNCHNLAPIPLEYDFNALVNEISQFSQNSENNQISISKKVNSNDDSNTQPAPEELFFKNFRFPVVKSPSSNVEISENELNLKQNMSTLPPKPHPVIENKFKVSINLLLQRNHPFLKSRL
jgi:hypothetical protein